MMDGGGGGTRSFRFQMGRFIRPKRDTQLRKRSRIVVVVVVRDSCSLVDRRRAAAWWDKSVSRRCCRIVDDDDDDVNDGSASLCCWIFGWWWCCCGRTITKADAEQQTSRAVKPAAVEPLIRTLAAGWSASSSSSSRNNNIVMDCFLGLHHHTKPSLVSLETANKKDCTLHGGNGGLLRLACR